MDFLYKKISNNSFHIISSESIIYKLPISAIPFGISNNDNKYVINLSINNKNDFGSTFLDNINQIETYFQGLDFIVDNDNNKILLSNKKFCSCIKQNNDFFPLFRSHIKKNKNMIITKFFINTKPITIFDIKPKSKCKGEIELGSLWFNNDSYGLIWFIRELDII
jgi:hypothetical protein